MQKSRAMPSLMSELLGLGFTAVVIAIAYVALNWLWNTDDKKETT